MILLIMTLLGAMLGSFAVATAWRLRAWQLVADQAQGVKLTKSEKEELGRVKKLRRNKGIKDRSICLDCGRQLKAIDLVPIVSWLCFKGKCRTCKAPIGYTEFLAEVGLAAAVVVSYVVWPFYMENVFAIILFGLWVLLLVCLTVHIVYDARWFLLLDIVTATVAIIAVLFVAARYFITGTPVTVSDGISIMMSLVLLPGLYWVLYVVSKGKWIGFGDVKLLIPLAIMLPGWPYAFLVIFLANLLGCLWIIPGMVTKKITRKTRIPFGPFLIVAWFIAMLWGSAIIGFYMTGGVGLF